MCPCYQTWFSPIHPSLRANSHEQAVKAQQYNIYNTTFYGWIYSIAIKHTSISLGLLLHTAHYCMLLLIRMSVQALMRWPLFTCSKTNTVTRLLEHVVRTTSQEPLRWQGNPLQSSRAYHMIAVYHNLKNIENQPTSASEMCRACEGQGTAASKHIRAIMLSATFTTSALGMPPAALWFRMPKHSSRFAPSFSTVLKHKRLARASVKLCFLYMYIYIYIYIFFRSSRRWTWTTGKRQSHS